MIPIQLKDMKFCRVLKKTKKPFEKAWQNKPYTYEEISQYFPRENYGVMAGFDGLGILDDDSSDKKLLKLAEVFGKTFRVRDHLYFKIKDWDGKKIIFFDKDGRHLGELQGLGSQAVGVGSIHPSGEVYDLREDLPIKEITFEEFEKVLGDYIIREKEKVVRDYKKTTWEGDNVTDIPITSIISLGGMKDMGGGQYQGEHPEHGSSNGMNFRVDTFNNTWKCFRNFPSHGGGGASELIAVMEGIIPCDQAGSNCFSQSQGQEVIQVAREKYGLRKPEQTTLEPRGWAISININKMAERNNLSKCPTCKNDFSFNEAGMYYCKTCKYGGGLNKFAELIIKQKEKYHDVKTY